MYDRLLVPVDGSAFSEEVLPYALGMSRATGASLTLLRVVDGAHPQAHAAQYVSKLADELRAEGKCVTVSGDVAATIVQEAERLPRTLVAMSSHGRAGILEAVLGSVALKLLRVGHRPVLVYRPRGAAQAERARTEKVESVVLPLDGNPLSEAMAPEAAGLARWLGARLVVVTVVDADVRSPAGVPRSDTMDSSYVRARATDLGRQYGLQVGWEVLRGSAGEAIADFVANRPGVMLAMATRGNAALRTALLGSVTAGCLRRSGVPILAACHGSA